MWRRRGMRMALFGGLAFLIVLGVAQLWTPGPLAMGDDASVLVGKRAAVVSSFSSKHHEVPCTALNRSPEKCDFVMHNADCRSFPALFDYLSFVFCRGIPMPVTCTLLFVWLLLLLFLLGTVAEDHFCPALSHLSETLRLPPDVAGITFLAFGNGSPDVFATVAAVQKGAFTISLGALTGAGAFVTMVVVGSVALVSDASLKPFPVVRDIVFYLVALSAITVICIDGQFSLMAGVLCMCFYAFYVAFVFVTHVVSTRWAAAAAARQLAKSKERRPLLLDSSSDDDEEDDDADIDDVGGGGSRGRGRADAQLAGSPAASATIFQTISTGLAPAAGAEEGAALTADDAVSASVASDVPPLSDGHAQPLPRPQSQRLRSVSDIHDLAALTRSRGPNILNKPQISVLAEDDDDLKNSGLVAAAQAVVDGSPQRPADVARPPPALERQRSRSVDLGQPEPLVTPAAVTAVAGQRSGHVPRRNRGLSSGPPGVAGAGHHSGGGSLRSFSGVAAAALGLGQRVGEQGRRSALEAEQLQQRRRDQVLWKRGIRLDKASHTAFVGEPAAVRNALAAPSGSLRRLSLVSSDWSDAVAAASRHHQRPFRGFSFRGPSSFEEERADAEGPGERGDATLSFDGQGGGGGGPSRPAGRRGRLGSFRVRQASHEGPMWASIIENYGSSDEDDGDEHFSPSGEWMGEGGELLGMASPHGLTSSSSSFPPDLLSGGDAEAGGSSVCPATCTGPRWARRLEWALDVVDWEDKSVMSRIVFTSTLPFTALFWLTIPHVEDEVWSRRLVSLTLFGAGGVVVVAFGLDEATARIGSMPLWLLPPLVGLACGVLLYWGLQARARRSTDVHASASNSALAQQAHQADATARLHPGETDGSVRFFGTAEAMLAIRRQERRPHGLLRFVLACVAFFMSVLWIYLVANELVALLQTFASLLQIREDLLGMTVLAWGNSVGDFVSNTVVARAGFPEMAIGAAYGGPMFNMVVGLGLGMTISNLRSFPRAYRVELTDAVVNALIFLVASLLLTLLVVGANRWTIPRKYGVFLIGVYVLFSAGAVLTELDVIHYLPASYIRHHHMPD